MATSFIMCPQLSKSVHKYQKFPHIQKNKINVHMIVGSSSQATKALYICPEIQHVSFLAALYVLISVSLSVSHNEFQSVNIYLIFCLGPYIGLSRRNMK